MNRPPTDLSHDDETATDESAASSFPHAVVVGLLAYLVSRLCVLAGAGVRASQVTVDARIDEEDLEKTPLDLVTGVFTAWDGRWYLEIVRDWYPDWIPPDITYDEVEARAAFFPLFPWLARTLDAVLPGGDTFAVIAVNFLLGGIAVVLVGLLARKTYSTSVAAKAMTLFAIFPGSFVLSFAYAEALLIVLAAACLLFLVDERWLLAGLAAALATATRPNGVGVVAACIVASFLAIRRNRDWSSLLAPALAPVGFVAFQLYIDNRTGERGAWLRVQREAWSEGTSFGVTAIKNTWGFLSSPLDSPTDALTALTVVALLFMLWCTWRKPMPAAMTAYSLVVVSLMLIPETVTARPRFLFTAFPLFISVAAWWPDPDDDPDHHRASWDRAGWDLTLVLCGAGLVSLTVLYAVFGAIP